RRQHLEKAVQPIDGTEPSEAERQTDRAAEDRTDPVHLRRDPVDVLSIIADEHLVELGDDAVERERGEKDQERRRQLVDAAERDSDERGDEELAQEAPRLERFERRVLPCAQERRMQTRGPRQAKSRSNMAEVHVTPP